MDNSEIPPMEAVFSSPGVEDYYIDIESRSLSICPTCRSYWPDRKSLSHHHSHKHHDNWEDLFWNYVDVGSEYECWDWMASVGNHGYGQFTISGDQMLSHRISYTLSFGEPDNNVLHHCHNKLCCNPQHLYDGTQQDNVDDMWEIGNANPKYGYGSDSNAAKLSEEDVIDIRERVHMGEEKSELSEEYRMSEGHIHKIVRGNCWPNTGGPTE